MAKVSGVYRIDDPIGGRFYIGSSIDISARWVRHLANLRLGKHENAALQRVWNKRPETLTMTEVNVIADATRASLLAAEQVELDAAGVGENPKCLNFLKVAGSRLGMPVSATTRAAIAKAQTGKFHTDAAKQKMRIAKAGKSLSIEHKQRIGEACRGKRINRPAGIVNHDLRLLTPERLRELRRMREAGMSWRLLGIEAGMSVHPCRRAVLGITYREVE